MKVTAIMLLKTNDEKMSDIGEARMYMKTMNIEAFHHYVDEK
jgi:predicted house-cleaning NTP pyrophosphatase (Maf/HAM1 superfamily)